MAVMYSKLVGCLGETTKLGPLARTDLCTWVKGLLDKLITHLGLGPSVEEPWGLFALILLGGSVAFLGISTTCLGSSAVTFGSLGCPKPSWAPVIPAQTVTCLSIVVSRGKSHCFLGTSTASCLGGSVIRCQNPTCLGHLAIHMENSTVCLGSPMPGWTPDWAIACLRPSVVAWVRRGELPSSWELMLLVLPSWEGVLLGRTSLASWEAALSQGRCLPACLWWTN